MNNATAMTPKMFTFAKATSEMDSFALAKASRGAAAKDNAEVVAAATDLDNCSLFCAINCFVVWEEAYICVVLRVIDREKTTKKLEEEEVRWEGTRHITLLCY
ncbi:unnamed protein product [Bathycoccus prasinos]